MTELTKYPLKLPSFNKFRITQGLTARSRNLTNRSMDNPQNDQKPLGRYTKSTPKYPETENFKKALLKIGAYPKEDFKIHFVPDEQDHKCFRRRVLDELKSKYLQEICEEEKAQPYKDDEIDEAALGCWKYGQSNTRKSIWKRYRQNLNQLNYETMRLAKKKGVL